MSAELALRSVETLRRSELDGRSWQPARSDGLSRRDVVAMVNEWMPYPLSPELLAIDLAAAAAEYGADGEALVHLEEPAVRGALAEVLERALGTGDLADEWAYRRSTTTLGLHRGDLIALSRLASHLGTRLERLFAEFDEGERLILRARSSGIQPLLGSEVARGGATSLMGDERPATRIDHAPIDLAVVPARAFEWDGPERDELRLIHWEGDPTAEVCVDVAAPGASSGEYTAFVSFGDRVAEGLLSRSAAGSFRAVVDFGAPVSLRDAHPARFGIRHAAVSTESALRRLASGEAEATRPLVETWARLRLWHASLAVGHIGAETLSDEWTTPSVPRSAAWAYDVLKNRRGELAPWAAALFAGSEDLLKRNTLATRRAKAFVKDALEWRARPTLSGSLRPLVSETQFVLGRGNVTSPLHERGR